MSAQSTEPVWSHIEVDGGLVKQTIITDHAGTRTMPYQAGEYSYFVDVIDAEGCRFGMWSGPSLAQALREAEALKRDFAVAEIADLTRGGRA